MASAEEPVVNVHEAKTHFSKLLVRVEAGERIVIARAGKPIAVVSPYVPEYGERPLGKDRGKISMREDFDDPLPEFEEYM